jgi:hypothetical protein
VLLARQAYSPPCSPGVTDGNQNLVTLADLRTENLNGNSRMRGKNANILITISDTESSGLYFSPSLSLGTQSNTNSDWNATGHF